MTVYVFIWQPQIYVHAVYCIELQIIELTENCCEQIKKYVHTPHIYLRDSDPSCDTKANKSMTWRTSASCCAAKISITLMHKTLLYTHRHTGARKTTVPRIVGTIDRRACRSACERETLFCSLDNEQHCCLTCNCAGTRTRLRRMPQHTFPDLFFNGRALVYLCICAFQTF